ncbi:MAG TPA: helix-turn-helix domain-containing protein [Flavitalea sp.]|nr:helix-turn-helix domain-containing protein [Flavitalea sp.]
MAAEIITKEDLQEFEDRLINKIISIVGQSTEQPQKWLKSYQVKNFLKISTNTLQTLRDNGTLPFSKIGGILYYSYDDILKILKDVSQTKRSVFN